jgi:hypothetical protein
MARHGDGDCSCQRRYRLFWKVMCHRERVGES